MLRRQHGTFFPPRRQEERRVLREAVYQLAALHMSFTSIWLLQVMWPRWEPTETKRRALTFCFFVLIIF